MTKKKGELAKILFSQFFNELKVIGDQKFGTTFIGTNWTKV